jgi:hypothetical protein
MVACHTQRLFLEKALDHPVSIRLDAAGAGATAQRGAPWNPPTYRLAYDHCSVPDDACPRRLC